MRSAPDDLSPLVTWSTGRQAAGVIDAHQILAVAGDPADLYPLASITKLLTTLATLVAWEEGSLGLDEPAGPPGATVRHLLAHASGLDPDRHESIARVGTKRIYSNAGIEQLAAHLSDRCGLPFETYLREAVLDPLAMTRTRLAGSPAHGAKSCLGDLLALARELLVPTIVDRSTLTEATTVQYPALAGVLPGFGRFDPNPWGLGFEIRGAKAPHWTAPKGSPRTFGHFGAAGSFMWVDPDAGLAAVGLADEPFGPWAARAWPAFATAVLTRYAP